MTRIVVAVLIAIYITTGSGQTAAAATNSDWLFLGDSIAARYAPDGVVNRAVEGSMAGDGWEHIDELLAGFDGKYVVLAWGSNDVLGATPAGYAFVLTAIVGKVRAAGKIPVIPTIPYSSIASRAGIEALSAKLFDLQVQRGPDFFTYFRTHQNELAADGLHLSPAGIVSYRAMWLLAMDGRNPDWGNGPGRLDSR